MNVLTVRATLKEEHVADAEAAVKRMFAAIEREGLEGIRYASIKLADGVTFLALLELEDGIENPLPALPEAQGVLRPPPGVVRGAAGGRTGDAGRVLPAVLRRGHRRLSGESREWCGPAPTGWTTPAPGPPAAGAEEADSPHHFQSIPSGGLVSSPGVCSILARRKRRGSIAMGTSYAYWIFEEIDETQAALVGGKGAHLGELSRIDGVRVPPGFCVTTDAFRRIMGDAPSIDERLDRLSRLDADDREAIRTLSAEIRRTLEASPSPTTWRRRSPPASPASASRPPTPSARARRRRTCRRPPSPASRTRT